MHRDSWIWRGPLAIAAAVALLGAGQMVPLVTEPGQARPVRVADAAPLAQATATLTPTPTATPTATPTLPPARVYSDATTGAVWEEQSFPRAGINCIRQTAGQAAGQFSCVPGTPVP